MDDNSSVQQLGRYHLVETLGSGSFATVWKAWDPELQLTVAIKVLADNWCHNADVCERFLAEARLLRRISSPQVVRVHDVGAASMRDGPMADGSGADRPYFVMDYVAGGTLADVVGTLSPAQALWLAIAAARAVQVLHTEGVVHRDLKPSNFLLDQSSEPPTVVVADLGSAKLLADASGLTVTVGTPAYMAPEQATWSAGIDARADVFALGVVTHELLTGAVPRGHEPASRFAPASVSADATTGHGSWRRDSPASRSSRNPRAVEIAGGLGLPSSLDAVLTAATCPDPNGRQPTAAALADQLAAIAAGREPQDLPQPVPAPGSLPLGAVVVLAVIVFSVVAAATWLVLR